MINKNFDVIIIGSGFGGAVTACRLAESGARVLVLERGRRWDTKTYPRRAKDPWVYEHTMPEKFNGWLDVRLYYQMAILLGAGVGGGSLCYSSVVLPANKERFDQGWPEEITYEMLQPYYDSVHKMMSVQEIPSGQLTNRYKLLQRGAKAIGYEDRFSSMPLALTFDENWDPATFSPTDYQHSKQFINDQGQQQGTCIHLGTCDIGCAVKAKNTLEYNYIPQAENHGAEVRPLHIVRYIESVEGGYSVVFDRIEDGKLIRGREAAEHVILAAGSLGSTELLLRSQKQYKTLPNISPFLGQRWSANANVLTPAFYGKDADIKQSIGPTISSGLEFMDGVIDGHRFLIEDDGFPNMLLNALDSRISAGQGGLLTRFLRKQVSPQNNPLQNLMIWLGAGVDAGDGTLSLGREWFRPWKRDIKLRWRSRNSAPVIDAILDIQDQLSDVTDGKLYIPLYWRLLKGMLTVHPLGGCGMGATPTTGVVNHAGEVYGYPNLYVADGAIIPKPIGRNPSMTIAALAEYIAESMVQK
ncbi:MAG: GMC family oxidoreductase [Chloroflexota bacterium]